MLTHSITLYLATVLIWGSTFFAIKFQLGDVPEIWSIAYRFGLAALLLWLWCLWRKLPLRFTLRQHGWMVLQGLFLFCLNYLLIYIATSNLTSGLIAVVFSSIVLMNILNGALFFGRAIEVKTLLGALLGVLGITFVFWPELAGLENNSSAFWGLILSIAGTYIASLGNMLSSKNQQQHLPVVQSNVFGMAYGAGIMALLALTQGIMPVLETSLSFNLSLLYLSLFGSVLAFGAYLTLVGRIGPAKAAYTMVLFPIVALCISTVFENYHWSWFALIGVCIVALGNLVILLPATKLKLMFRLK
ncbi:DMT family transporter [Rheinheimera sediminis]|uniref:DMT family transporter n=1 Tax=Rheinheimera sp. YQF-1 TaxID=2499626 RepID=UPI000FD7D314|nr:DMT family transporter [Rheinheimera sp. YQF-1]RVT46209.1 DMT family transporter [Rheinheimera sp. YQF-1]